MQYIYTFFTLLSLAFFTTSCEETVDLSLRESESKHVIDASITENHPCVVFITKSQAFNNNDPYERVAGATVELYDDFGGREIMKESLQEAGLYVSETIGVANRKYYLKISAEEKEYEAQSIIPEAVAIDSIYIYNIKIGNEPWYSPAIIFKDPVNVDNYYYSLVSINGKTLKSIYINNDQYRNGLEVDQVLFFYKEENNNEELKIGDLVHIEMQTLDKGMYIYYNSLYTVAAGGATNPITNFSGGALGCFKAYNSSSKEITISEDRIYSEK